MSISSFMKPIAVDLQQKIDQVKEDKAVINPTPISPIEGNKDNTPSPYVLEVKGLTHVFDKGTDNEYKLFDNFNLTIERKENSGEIISIMGGSGCGKSCILKMAAGLMTPQQGEIRIYGKTVSEYGNIPMVFQSYSSYEWMTVLDNVALPFILKGMKKKQAREKAKDVIKLVGLEEQENKYAKSSVLSGGQLQRVSIARCIASGSKIFFLDESTGALDIKMKREVQNLILQLRDDVNLKPTIINVTHSIEEALYISDKIIVLRPNPCTIHKTMDIDYNGCPRGNWVFETEKHNQYSKELSSTLYEVSK